MRTRAVILSLLVAAGLYGVACSGGKKPPLKEPTITETIADAGSDAEEDAEPPAPKSLYERLGGKEGIAAVVDTFLKNVAADNKVNKRFAKLNAAKMDKLKQSLVDMLCVESGGPEAGADCKYEGKSMKDAHKGMKIKEEEWQAFIVDLNNALQEQKVGETEQADLMSALGKFHDEIVEVKPKAKK